MPQLLRPGLVISQGGVQISPPLTMSRSASIAMSTSFATRQYEVFKMEPVILGDHSKRPYMITQNPANGESVLPSPNHHQILHAGVRVKAERSDRQHRLEHIDMSRKRHHR